MASKLIVVAALFVCFLVADASFRVTTTVVEDENPQQRGQQCRQEVQRQSLQTCQQYVSRQQQQQQQQQGGRGRFDELIEMNRPQQSVPQQCCDELQQVQRECRCEALEQIVEKVQQQQQGRFSGRSSRGSQQQKVQQQVRQIPEMCRVQVPQQCSQQQY